MAKQIIKVGSTANDGTGDTLRDAGVKINANFTELYSISGLDTTFTQGAFNTANSGVILAQSAFNKANTGTSSSSNTLVNGSYTVGLDVNGFLNLANTNNSFLGNSRIGGGLIGPYFGDGGGIWLANTLNNSFYTVMATESPTGLGYFFTATFGGNDVAAGIQTYDDANTQYNNWTFQPNGEMQLPNGGIIGGTNNITGITMTTSRGQVLFGNIPEVGPTDVHHFHIMKANTANTDLFFGDDFNYVKLPKDSDSGVEIGTNYNNNIWRFGTDGDLNLPINGGIVFDRANTSIRVGMGFHITSGEGINLQAIDSNNNFTSNNWYFSPTGVMSLPNGSLITDNSSALYLHGIMNTQIQAGLDANTKSWNFDASGALTFPDNKKQITAYDGKLTLPADGYIVDSHGISVIVHPYVLDVEIDGGTTNSVYSKNDIVFDGGSTSTIFTFGQAVIDGCSAFSHSISKNFDGGSAVTI